LDGDGCPTASDTGLRIDNHPEDSTRCDEDLDFDLPAQLNLHAVGSETTWTTSVDWKSTIASTESVSIYGLSWNSTEGIEHLLLNLEPPGAIPWWSDNAPDGDTVHTMFEYPRGTTHDRLTLRLISTSEDGQTLEYWVNSTYDIETEEPPVEPSEEEEMVTCDACCSETVEVSISIGCDSIGPLDCAPCEQIEGESSVNDNPERTQGGFSFLTGAAIGFIMLIAFAIGAVVIITQSRRD